MGSYGLPALDIKTPQQPDLLEKYSQLQALRGQQQQQQQAAVMAPLQQQQAQQNVQQGGIALEQAQQGQKDQLAFRAALSDPANQGKTIGQVADALAHSGSLSPATYQSLKKADLEQQQSIAILTKEQLEAAAKGHAATQELYNNIMNLPDDQLTAQWPQIAQQYDSIPGNNKQPLNPQQPLTKQQLQQFGPLLSMQGAYIQNEAAKKTAAATLAEKQADAQLHQLQADRGGTTEVDKYTFDYLKSHNLTDTPENRQTAFKAYTKETKLDPASVRASIMLQTPTQVYNPDSGQVEYATRKDAIGKLAPGSAEALGAKAGVQADAASLKKLQTNYDSVTAFENTAGKNLDTFLKTAKDVVDTGSPFLNTPVRMVTSQMVGSEKMAAFNAARQTAVSEIGKVLSSANAGSGVVSDSARHEVESLIGPNATLKQIYAAANILKQDMENRKTAYADQIGEIKGRMGNGSKPAQQAAPQRPAGVPANAVWNPQGHNGAGSWQLPQ